MQHTCIYLCPDFKSLPPSLPLTQHGFIRHTVNKITFSEQCYYIFGDFRAAANSLPSGSVATICKSSLSVHCPTSLPLAEFSNLHLSGDSGEDTLGPLPGANMWGSSEGEFSLPAYEFFTRPNHASSSSKSNSPSPGETGILVCGIVCVITASCSTCDSLSLLSLSLSRKQSRCWSS